MTGKWKNLLNFKQSSSSHVAMNTNIVPTTNVKLRPLDFAFDTTSDMANEKENNFWKEKFLVISTHFLGLQFDK